MSATLLFEVGAEELPPSDLPDVLDALRTNAARDLADARLPYESLTIYSTPRRLAILARGLADRQPSQRGMVTGPPKKAAFDAAGKPTKAAEGFARSQGVGVDQLVTISTERGDYIAVDRVEEGRAASCPTCWRGSSRHCRSRNRCAGATASHGFLALCAGSSRSSTTSFCP